MSQGRWLLLFSLLFVLAACAAHDTAAPAARNSPAGSVPGLGSPAELLRSASFADESQVRTGAEFDPALPNALVFPGPPGFSNAVLSPVITAQVGHPAYALYSFDLTGYDEEPLVKLSWKNTPIGGNAWLGLANWDKNRWDFIAADPTSVSLPSLDPYIDANGKLLAAIVVAGTAERELRWLVIGDVPAPSKPVVNNIAPTSGAENTFVTMVPDVTGTEPLTYSWDFGGGATPNTSTDAQPLVQLSATGTYDGVLTVSNKYGVTQYDFSIFASSVDWSGNLVGDGGDNRFVALDTTLDNSAVVGAEMDDQRISLFRFDGSSALQWNYAYTGLQANRIATVELGDDSGAEIYVACYDYVGSGPAGNAYILKTDADGVPLWYLPLGSGIPDLDQIDGSSFCASLAMPNGQSRLIRFNADGTVAWAKETTGAPITLNSCSAGIDGSAFDSVYACGISNGSLGVVRVALDGTPVWVYELPEATGVDVQAVGGAIGVAVTGVANTHPINSRVGVFAQIYASGQVFTASTFDTGHSVVRHLSKVEGLYYLTTGEASLLTDVESRLYRFNVLSQFTSAYVINGLGDIIGGESKMTRTESRSPGENLIFVGAGSTTDVSFLPLTQQPLKWEVTPVSRTLDLTDVTLPTETLTITPESGAFAVGVPAGGLDGLIVRVDGMVP